MCVCVCVGWRYRSCWAASARFFFRYINFPLSSFLSSFFCKRDAENESAALRQCVTHHYTLPAQSPSAHVLSLLDSSKSPETLAANSSLGFVLTSKLIAPRREGGSLSLSSFFYNLRAECQVHTTGIKSWKSLSGNGKFGFNIQHCSRRPPTIQHDSRKY